jgi:hypothetical protein
MGDPLIIPFPPALTELERLPSFTTCKPQVMRNR